MEKPAGSESDDLNFGLLLSDVLERHGSSLDLLESDDDDSVVVEGGRQDLTELGSTSVDNKSLSKTITLDPLVEQYSHVRCEAVIEILEAKVVYNDNISLDVYGDIRILDLKQGREFIVYERDQFDSPQGISTINSLLQLSSPGEIPTFDDPHLAVDIKNVHTGAVIARGQKPLSKTTHEPFDSNDFEKLYTLQFQGDAGDFVELQCVAFTFGVYAQVEIVLFRDSDASHSMYLIEDEEGKDGKGVEVFGLICGECDPLILPKTCYTNHLFNVIQEESEWVTLGTEIALSKSLVAVPAYSPLKISMDLRGYDGIIVQGTQSFEPTNYDGGKKCIQGLNGFYVRVHVKWCEPSLLNKPWCDDDRIARFCSMTHEPSLYASQLLEVFSLFISHPNEQEVNLYGSVKILDSKGWCSIFNRSEDEAYCLAQGSNFLPLKEPKRAITPGDFFSIEIDLRDVDGHVNIKGFVKSSPEINERQRPWFDEPLRSVVRSANEKSFAVIDYILFSFAVLAIIEVRFVFHHKYFDHVKIYGDITTYTAQGFRRVLFTRKKENFLKIKDDLKLLTKHVVVPMRSPLLTKVDLSLRTSGQTFQLKKRMKFQIGEPCKIIQRDCVSMFIDVKWKGLPYV
ncbi:hypothetical protein DCAR_0105026 [Daucus carota subsp. sativus]|uniref:DUF6598 domain-containing protein n=1 Tax=Daucus carota subsp. sativus TaxID=79200 RepID=A0AAF0WCP7_DAUCS|nr:PREDICTED: uncharacterized protein LOC108207240 [Daucus carota subsp. sativus]WOG85833.1 hypothetical protein DCAR_0105026 [Daucus carota subsp. sativus]